LACLLADQSSKPASWKAYFEQASKPNEAQLTSQLARLIGNIYIQFGS